MTEKATGSFADASKTFKHKKIFITSLHLMHGGVEMVISSLANAFVEMGFDVEVLCVYCLGEPAYFFDSRVKITYLTDVHPNRDEFKRAVRSKNPFRVIKEALYAIKVLRLKTKSIVKAIKSIDDGVVISTRAEHSVLLSKYGKKGVLKIAQLHFDHKFEDNLLNDFKFKYNNIDYFTLLTPQMTDEVKNIMEPHNKNTKCVTVPNFLYKFPNVDATAKRINQVVSVGRFSPEKGFLRLLDAWKIFVNTHPDWCLKLIGDGAEREALEKKVREYDLQNSVIFTGMIPNDKVIEELCSSKIYALPSFTEALPTVIIEAGVCQVPAVAFDVRGPQAVIKNNESGIMVADNDIEAFAGALSELADNDALRSEMGDKACELAKYYSKENIMELWMKLLSDNNMKGDN